MDMLFMDYYIKAFDTINELALFNMLERKDLPKP